MSHNAWVMSHGVPLLSSSALTRCNTLQHPATHCNTLQHTATHSNTQQHIFTHGVRLLPSPALFHKHEPPSTNTKQIQTGNSLANEMMLRGRHYTTQISSQRTTCSLPRPLIRVRVPDPKSQFVKTGDSLGYDLSLAVSLTSPDQIISFTNPFFFFLRGCMRLVRGWRLELK